MSTKYEKNNALKALILRVIVALVTIASTVFCCVIVIVALFNATALAVSISASLVAAVITMAVVSESVHMAVLFYRIYIATSLRYRGITKSRRLASCR